MGDFNSHHRNWCLDDINFHGDTFNDFFLDYNFKFICNNKKKGTWFFTNKKQEKCFYTIDLIVSNFCFIDIVDKFYHDITKLDLCDLRGLTFYHNFIGCSLRF